MLRRKKVCNNVAKELENNFVCQILFQAFSIAVCSCEEEGREISKRCNILNLFGYVMFSYITLMFFIIFVVYLFFECFILRTHVCHCFSELPSESARVRLKKTFVKDF